MLISFPLIISIISTFLLELTLSARYYVNSEVSQSEDGTSWDTAFRYLDDAIKAVKTNRDINEIWITQGIYYPQTTNRSSCFSIPLNTNIYGGFVGSENSISERVSTESLSSMTILDGDINNIDNVTDNCYHVVTITNGTLDSIVIRNGNADKDGDGAQWKQYGGGMYIDGNDDTNVALNNVQFIDNKAHSGGAIYLAYSDASLHISKSIFEANVAERGSYVGGYGGALYIAMGANIEIIDTQFINNKATYRGGAIYQDYGATITCEKCLLLNNSATSGHGGAWFAENRNSQLGTTTSTAIKSNFSSNYAFGYGGACTFLKDSIVIFEDNYFDDNMAENSGGAITYYDVTNLTSINNEFYNNRANEDPSTDDIYNGSFPDFTVMNTSISYNISDYLRVLWEQRSLTKEYNDDLAPASLENMCYVKSCDNCPSGDGSSWNNAYTIIQDCIDKLKTLDSTEREIWVAKGTYYPTSGLPFSEDPDYPYFYSFLMSPYIRLYGGFNGDESKRSQRNWYLNPTYLSCDLGDISCTIIMSASQNNIIDGFIFTGALYNKTRESGPSNSSSYERRRLTSTYNTVSEVVENISGGRGGGVFSNGTNAIIVNSIFFENLAVKGGGVYCIGLSSDGVSYKSPTIKNAAFINNMAVRGGALMGDVGCEFECDTCLFENNLASEKGGAVYLDYYCNASVHNSQFVNNLAYESGGCVSSDGLSYIELDTNIFNSNSAKWEAGCLYGGSHVSGTGVIFSMHRTIFQNNSAYYGFDDIWVWLKDELTFIDDDLSTTSSPIISPINPAKSSLLKVKTVSQLETAKKSAETKIAMSGYLSLM